MRPGNVTLRRPTDSFARVRTALAPSPVVRRCALVGAVAVALLAALYLAWLRDSSLVAVESVTITGVTSRDADRVRAALTSTAMTMTTLNLDREKLEEAAAVFPVVAAIELTPDFPHGLTIEVIEHRPVAIVDAGGDEAPVAADGSVLTGLPVEGDLPRIEMSQRLPGDRLPAGAARDAARVAGGAPAALASRLEGIGREGGARGVVVQVQDGPEIVFGSADQLRAKWAAAVRVLADSESAGASYIDVRLPERPVAGGLTVETVTPVAPATEAPVDPVVEAPVTPTPETVAPTPGAVVPAPVEDTPDPVAPVPPTDAGGLGASPQP
jgi:cell division protein FtsQ